MSKNKNKDFVSKKTDKEKASSKKEDSASKSNIKDEVPLSLDGTQSDSKTGETALASLNAIASDVASAGSKDVSKGHYSHEKGDSSHSQGKRYNDHKGGDQHHGGNKSGNVKGRQDPKPQTTVNTSANQEMGVVYLTRNDRAVTEYTEPNDQQLSLLGVSASVNGINWKLETDLRVLASANTMNPNADRSIHNITQNALDMSQAMHSINTILWKHNTYKVGSAKMFDNMFSQSFETMAARARETNTGIVNYYYQPDLVLPYGPWRQRGFMNSMWPFSSLVGAAGSSLPFLPSQVDDIMLFSLDGGAFLKSTNRLNPCAADAVWSHLFPNAQCYELPGIPGFNHYESQNAIDNGNIVATHEDARTYVDRQYIYDGERFSTNHNAWAALNHLFADIADNAPNASIVRFRHDYNDIFDFGALRDVNQQVNNENFMTYPDYNYSVISSDFNKLFRALRALVQKNVVHPKFGQLVGLVDKQAFFNAVQSAIHFATFFRCLLYSIMKTYSNLGFTKAKLGQVCYNDNLLKYISKDRWKASMSFFNTLANEVLPYLPYNKYSFENFKVWFDTSMLSGKADAFDENNPVMSIRAIFCGISEITNFNPFNASSGHDSRYYPQNYNASALTTDFTNILHIHDSVTNVWGYYVKSLSLQSIIFVPHGDVLCNFFAYFPELFTNRPWTRDGHTDPLGQSLTAILDPMNFTGFAANFFAHPDTTGYMSKWVKDYVHIVAAFYDIIKAIGDNSATIHFDDNVEWTMPDAPVTPTILPGFKQHILDYFQNTPRIMRANLANRGTVEADIDTLEAGTGLTILVGHQPTIGFSVPHDQIGVTGLANTFLQHVSTPRLGLDIPKSSLYYDFGTAGTQLYNVSNPWATSARPYADNAVANTVGNLNHTIRQFLMDNGLNRTFLSAHDVEEPFDMYQAFWYPSFWHMPYYQRQYTRLTPCYDIPLGIVAHPLDPTVFNGGSQLNITAALADRLDTFKGFAYDYIDDVMGGGANPNLIGREYREIFAVHRVRIDAPNVFRTMYPAASCLRLLYGSGNTQLVLPEQYVLPNIIGYQGETALNTRQNTVSIFTAYNIRCVGLPTTRSNVEYSQDLVGHRLYREVLFDRFSKSLGIPYQPFLCVSAGASLFFDQVYSCVPYINTRSFGSDIDLSAKFYNILSNITKLDSGDYDGEAYPSSDGWGTDQLTHPDKMNINTWYSNFMKDGADTIASAIKQK